MQHVKTDGGASGVAALEVSAVSHSYGQKRALSEVSFSIAPATFTVLLGLNGAGKTTLFSLISHLYNTRHGSIRIFGHDISRASGEALRRLGIVFQARTLDLDLSVYQNLSYHASLHGIGSAEARRRIETLLADRRDERSAARQGAQPLRRPDATHRDCPRAAAPAARCCCSTRRLSGWTSSRARASSPTSAAWWRPKASACSGQRI